MDTFEVITTRRSVRKFLDTPVEQEKLDKIFEIAQRSPSWANSQPWQSFVASGETLKRIKAAYAENYANKVHTNLETPRPQEWNELAKQRMKDLRPTMVRDCGEAVEEFVELNQTMFGAPTVIFLCKDKILKEWAMYDIGAYSQSIMLAAKELGLGAIQAIQVVNYPDVLRKEMSIPETFDVMIGIAIGYADYDHKINNFVSDRDPIEDCVRFFD